METPELLFKPMPTESLSSAQLRLQEHPAMTKPKEPYTRRRHGTVRGGSHGYGGGPHFSRTTRRGGKAQCGKGR